MTNKILDHFSHEEIKNIIEASPISFTKEFLKKHTKFFNTVKPGFRADHIKPSELVQGAINLKDPIWAPYSTTILRSCHKFFNEQINKKIEDSIERELAEYLTFKESPFSDNVNLFLKLTGLNEYSCQKWSDLLFNTMKDIRNTKEKLEIENSELDEKLKHSKSSNENLIQALKISNTDNEVYRQRILSLENENTSLKADLNAEIHNNWYSRKAETALQESPNFTTPSEYKFTSLCVVREENRRLERIADLIDGVFVKFSPNPYLTAKCDNRKSIFNSRNRTGSIGTYSIWNWKWYVIDDPEKDRVDSELETRIRPIEVTILPNCLNINDVINTLKNGIDNLPNSSAELFVFKTNLGNYQGFLVQKDQLERLGNTYKIKQNILSLPLYEFDQSDFIENKFYKALELNKPYKIIELYSKAEAMKQFFFEKLKKDTDLHANFTKDELGRFKESITNLQAPKFYTEFSERLGCSIEIAKSCFDEFLKINLSSREIDLVEEKHISKAIMQLPQLADKVRLEIKTQWQRENQSIIDTHNKIISDLEDKIQASLTQIEELEKTKNSLEEEIHNKKNFKDDLELEIDACIEDAQTKSANFIAKLTLLKPFISTNIAPAQRLATNEQERRCSNLWQVINVENSDTPYNCEDVDDFIDLLNDNLVHVGFDTESTDAISRLLTYCIFSKVPIICSGNSQSIITAIAATLGFTSYSIINGCNANEITIDENLPTLCINAFNQFSASTFNALEAQFKSSTSKAIIFSLDGMELEDLPRSVLDRSFYIDGDRNFSGKKNEALELCTFNLDQQLALSLDTWDKAERNIRPFAEIISNRAKALYCKFYTFIPEDQSLKTILLQIQAQAKNRNLEELFDELTSTFSQHLVQF